MLRPPKLNKNDTIRILTTARKVDLEDIQDAIEWLKGLGFQVSLGKTISLSDHQYGGTDAERATDFQEALDDNNVKAIWFARGGYGSIRFIKALNWDGFVKNPKWLIGFSDITVWHNIVNQFYAIQTLHAAMPMTFPSSTAISKKILGSNILGDYPSIEFANSKKNIRTADIEGEIIGGNLSILYSLLGTETGFNTNGRILFIEEIDEYLYHVDRMMISLKLAGKLDGLKALVIGGFTDMKDHEISFGKSYSEIIAEHSSEYDYPVIFDFPAGHIDDNRPLILGSRVKFKVEENWIKMKYL